MRVEAHAPNNGWRAEPFEKPSFPRRRATRTLWEMSMKKSMSCGVLVLALWAIACGSTDSGSPGSAGSPPGASGGQPGTAGSAASAGSTASGGGSSDLCSQQFDAMEKKCPVGADSKSGNVEACHADQQDYAGNGCLTQFNSWLSCTATNPAYDCETDTGCETSQGSYFTCQAQAVQRTGCVRLGSQDKTRCSDAAKPYAFSCLAAAPSTCVQVVTEGAGIWCCPQL